MSLLEPMRPPPPGATPLSIPSYDLLDSAHITTTIPEHQSAPPTQSVLPSQVTTALAQLNELLSRTPASHVQSLAQPLALFSNETTAERDRFISALTSEVLSLYVPREGNFFDKGQFASLTGAISELTDHFSTAATLLARHGYNRFYMNVTRNSFADRLHMHTYLSYILYCGREVGTEVVLHGPEEDGLLRRYRKDDWQRASYDLSVEPGSTLLSLTSDTANGLFLPPYVAHRARSSHTPHGKEQANLALVLLAFKK